MRDQPTTTSAVGLHPGPFAAHARLPVDMAVCPAPGVLLRRIAESAKRACAELRLEAARSPSPVRSETENLLVLVAYAYLQNRYHSFDVVRCLDSDPELGPLWHLLAIRPEQIRRFRREHRSLLVDCMAGALLSMDSAASALSTPSTDRSDAPLATRLAAGFLGHFLANHRRAAEDRIDRAIILDSMALDF